MLNAEQEPHNWLTYYGNYKGWRYSNLAQINTTNVQKLRVQWAFVPGAEEDFQVTPIVADGVMYITSPMHTVYALDATNGRILWRHNHKFPEKMPAAVWGPSKHRGVSLAGDRVILATNDGQILALDAKTGKQQWTTQAADYQAGLGFNQPPLIVGDKAIVGTFTAARSRSGMFVGPGMKTGFWLDMGGVPPFLGRGCTSRPANRQFF